MGWDDSGIAILPIARMGPQKNSSFLASLSLGWDGNGETKKSEGPRCYLMLQTLGKLKNKKLSLSVFQKYIQNSYIITVSNREGPPSPAPILKTPTVPPRNG